MTKEQCKETVYDALRRKSFNCSRNATKDGYCKQHHPDAVAKRNKETEARWEAKRKCSPEYKLRLTIEKIKELEAEIEELKAIITDRG